LIVRTVFEILLLGLKPNFILRYDFINTLIEVIDWNEIIANEVTGSLAHSAYHLGAILQILKRIRDI
jgi:hypothetical protein